MTDTDTRLQEAKDKLAADKKSDAMLTAGFDNESDFDAWKVLEELRKTTLEIRKRESDRDRSSKRDAYYNGGFVFNAGTPAGSAGRIMISGSTSY